MSDKPIPPKRFYKTVSTEKTDGGFGVFLDGRQTRTATRQPVISPTEKLANAVAYEWRAQDEHIERETMPLMALLSASIDAGATGPELWRNDILGYLKSDLLCYRADAPQALVAQQNQVWGPYLDWFEQEYSERLRTTTGVIAIAQPASVSAAVEAVLKGAAPVQLLAVKTITAILGSAVLALALWRSAFAADDIFDASRLDERFQEDRWGTDAEAKAREEIIRKEYAAAAKFLTLTY